VEATVEEQTGTGRRSEPAAQAGHWRASVALAAVLGVFYALLQNGQWVPVSDGDLYLTVARNLARGQGFTFKRLPVEAIPPGWPLVLSLAMRVSSSFRFLALIPMSLVIGALVLFHRILLRLTSARRAFIVCLTVGILSPVYHRTFMFHSEGLFTLLCAGAVLLALQVNEGRGAAWRIPLLLLACVAAQAVRWPGLLMTPVIAGALLSGHVRPAWNRLWVTAALVGLLLCGTFLALRYIPASVVEPDIVREQAVPAEAGTYATREHPIVAKLRRSVFRLPRAGLWFCKLLAEPARVGRTFKPLGLAANLAGWVAVGFFVAGAIPFAGRRQWLVPGAALYTLALVGLWQNAVPRYLMPVAPLLFLGILNGVDRLPELGPWKGWVSLRRIAVFVLFTGIAACNLSLYAVDVWKLHSDDFYGEYMGGQAKPLIAIAEYLKAHDVKDGEVARKFVGLDWEQVSPSQGYFLELRGLSLLINRVILTAPRELADQEPGAELAEWAAEKGVRFYIDRPPINPWRIWHFRVPRIQQWVTGRPVGEPSPYYVLYEFRDGRFQRVALPGWDGRIERVPGL